MIQLIRRFLNSENMPLNRILRTGLEELSNKMGESDGKTLFDVIGSLNTDATKPLNELINDIKTKVGTLPDKYYAPSSSVLMNLGFTTTKCEAFTTSTSTSTYARTCMKASDNFIPEGNGIINISGTTKGEFTYSGDGKYTAYPRYMVSVIALGSALLESNYAISESVTDGTSYDDTKNAMIAASKAKGTNLKKNMNTSDNLFTKYASQSRLHYYRTISKSGVVASGSFTDTFSIDVPVEKGYPVFVLLETYVQGSGSSGKITKTSCVLTDLKIKGELKEF